MFWIVTSHKHYGQRATSNLIPSLLSPWPAVGKPELWEQPFWSNKGNNQTLSIRFHCAVCIYGTWLKWMHLELSFSHHWPRGMKTPGMRLGHEAWTKLNNGIYNMQNSQQQTCTLRELHLNDCQPYVTLFDHADLSGLLLRAIKRKFQFKFKFIKFSKRLLRINTACK